jgi:serralysin
VLADTNYYEMNPATGALGVVLQYQGAYVTLGQLGGWSPKGAVATASGFQVAWKMANQDQYTIWNTDANGNYTSSATGAVSGTSLTLGQAETAFNLDLNSDGRIGPTRSLIKSNNVTALNQYGDAYMLAAVATGTGPLLQNGGVTVLSGAYGGWTPIGATKTATGYQVAWKVTGQDQYTIWNTDTNGNFTTSATGVISGMSLSLEQAETTFSEDLNGDFLTGPVTTLIASNGVTKLVQYANTYQLNTAAGIAGPTIQYQGAAAISGQFGAWNPIGAVKAPTGYQIAWKISSQDLYTVWNLDPAGNFLNSATGGLSGTSLTIEQYESTFNLDLNGDGRIGVVTSNIASNGTTLLQQTANTYVMTPVAGGSGPTLQFQGSAAIVGQFGGWVPIGALRTATGYQIAWKVTGQDQYTVWNTDSNGNYTNSASDALSGFSLTLEQFETIFQIDLNSDHTIGPVTTTIASNGVTALQQVANVYQFTPVAGGTGPTLQYQGAAVAAGQLGAWTPIGAVKTSIGYQVAWKITAQNLYTVWNTNTNGAYTSSATGGVVGQDFTLEDLEASFKEDLNGDGRLSATLITAPTSGSTLNLSGQAAAVTINLGTDNASASSGLSAPSLTFIGSPDAITLGTGVAIIEYALNAASGIETVSNFALGTDELNIDLLGAAANTLQIFDTTVSGGHAVAFTSSSDHAHGIVLLGLPASTTAAFLSSGHLALIGGHALIS